MHLVVDHAGQQKLPGGIDLQLGFTALDAAGDLFDAAVMHPGIGVELAAFVDQAGVADQQVAHIQNSFCRAL